MTPFLQKSLRSKTHALSRPISIGQAIQRRCFVSFGPEETPYWQKLKPWQDVTHEQFLSYEWQVNKTPKGTGKLLEFLEQIVPAEISDNRPGRCESPVTRQAFLLDIREGIKAAPMAVRLTPHLLSIANWESPFDDPIIRQFIPLKSNLVPDHPMATFDSLDEKKYSPVIDLVHRYPDRVLFLATGTCPSYCRFCTRSYAIGTSTDTVQKTLPRPGRAKWTTMLNYVEEHSVVRDVVVSGGDSYTLHPEHLTFIGDRLLQIDHMKCFRIAARGPSFCPMRIIDPSDLWGESLIDLSNRGRQSDKEVVLHTHFNHPAEINWLTQRAMRHLFRRGVTVRNQTVLLRGVNDNVETMSNLIRSLADVHVKPYYVYQMDMVKGVEDLRTPLSTILELENHITGTITGFDLPKFVVDLPGGGGKRPASTFDTYDRETGVSTFRAPGIAGDRVFTYYDPLPRA